MEEDHLKRIRRRYLLAIVSIALVIFGLLILNFGVYFIITRFFPSLTPYVGYVIEGSRALIGILGAYIVYKILISIVYIHGLRRHDMSSVEVAKILLRILFYAAVISIVLSALGISLTTALAGGAIGGIVIGLAVQTIATSVLSGVIVGSSKTIIPGDIMVLHSTLWGDMLCKVNKVSIVLTEVTTHDGINVKVPNTALLSSTVFSHLKNEGVFSYPFQVTINSDVPLKSFESKLNKSFVTRLKRKVPKMPKVYLMSKIAAANVFEVILYFDNFDRVNDLIGIVNNCFDDVYWSLKDT